MSILNSVGGLFEEFRYGDKIRSTKIHQSPIFVLGQPRSGTTLLHQLLALDEGFATPTITQVAFAQSYLTCGYLVVSSPLCYMLSPTRPMDNMTQAWDSPCEDEIATLLLSHGCSPYMALTFLRDWKEFIPSFLTFPNGVTSKSFLTWKAAFLSFCRKLQFAAGQSKRLLLKSPVHTARIPLLKTLFENPKFVYIHRNPHEVFQSSITLVDRQFSCCALQKMTDEDAESYIFDNFVLTHQAYMDGKRVLRAGDLCEVSFNELVTNTEETLAKIYETLCIPRTEETKRRQAQRTSDIADFQMNSHKPLTKNTREAIYSRWRAAFEDHGYCE